MKLREYGAHCTGVVGAIPYKGVLLFGWSLKGEEKVKCEQEKRIHLG